MAETGGGQCRVGTVSGGWDGAAVDGVGNEYFWQDECRQRAQHQKARSAVGYVDGQTAKRGFLVMFVHVPAGLAHGFNRGIQRDEMLPVPA